MRGRLRYRCRLYGLEWDDGPAYPDLAARMADQVLGHETHREIIMKTIHKCEPGRIGVVDLVGVMKVED